MLLSLEEQPALQLYLPSTSLGLYQRVCAFQLVLQIGLLELRPRKHYDTTTMSFRQESVIHPKITHFSFWKSV